jgi:hypothetical protein
MEQNACRVAKDGAERINHEPGPAGDFIQLLLLLLLLKRIIIQDKKHFSKRVAVINVCPVMFIKIKYNCILYNINYNIRY